MSVSHTGTEWPTLAADDPPLDLTRENHAYEKEQERLLRDHYGKIALIHEDDVVGVFATTEEALREGYRRFGLVRMVFRQISDPEPADFVSHVDTHHPSFKRLD